MLTALGDKEPYPSSGDQGTTKREASQTICAKEANMRPEAYAAGDDAREPSKLRTPVVAFVLEHAGARRSHSAGRTCSDHWLM